MGYHRCEECKNTFGNRNALKQHQNSSVHQLRNIKCPFQRLGCTSGPFISVAALARHIDAQGCTTFITRRQFNEIAYDLNQSDDGERYSVIDPDINPRTTGISKDTVDSIIKAAGRKVSNREDYFWTCTYPGCVAEFKAKDSLKAHLQSPTHEARMYRCPGCNADFPDLGSACSHIEQNVRGCNIEVKAVIKEVHELITAVKKKKVSDRTSASLRAIWLLSKSLRQK
ncbi:hypothetical protein H1R20_g1700, partial [Candolleomyces eurysporus]